MRKQREKGEVVRVLSQYLTVPNYLEQVRSMCPSFYEHVLKPLFETKRPSHAAGVFEIRNKASGDQKQYLADRGAWGHRLCAEFLGIPDSANSCIL
jgi:hypothetical protein